MPVLWKRRTSLSRRLIWVFVLLVTIPLLLSTLILAAIAHDRLQTQGTKLADITGATLAKTLTNLVGSLTQSLSAASDQVVKEGQDQLASSSEEAITAGSNAVRGATEAMRKRGEKAVDEAVEDLVTVQDQSLTASLDELRKINEESLRQISASFSDSMKEQLAQSDALTAEVLQTALETAWDDIHDRRAVQLRQALIGSIGEFQAKAEGLLQEAPMLKQFSDPEQAMPRLRNNIYKKQPGLPDLARVVMVDPQGKEFVRVPDDDLDPNEAPPNWADSDPLQRIQAAARVIYPPHRDPKNEKYVMRIIVRAEKVDPVLGLAEQDFGFILMDVVLDGLAQETFFSTEEGEQILLLQAGTGLVYSSLDPKHIGSQSAVIAKSLPPLEQANAQKPEPFEFSQGEEGVTARGIARTWEGADGQNLGLWFVITQPESEVLRPLKRMQVDIASAWQDALRKVNESSAEVIAGRMTATEKAREQIASASAATIRKQQGKVTDDVSKAFKEQERRSVDQVQRDLEDRIEEVKAEAAGKMVAAAALVRQDAEAEVQQTVKRQQNQALLTIRRDAGAASRGAGYQMLVLTGWLVPLFLLLALVAATLTARSIVRPIDQLVQGTEALAKGKYDQRLPLTGDDELRRLGRSFNEMAAAVQSGQAELQRANDELLGEKQRIEAILENSPDGLVMIEGGDRVSLMNPVAANLLGVPGVDMPTAPFRLDEAPPAVAERFRECLEQSQNAEAPGEVEYQEPERRVLQVRRVRLARRGDLPAWELVHLHDITRERVIDEMKSDFISLVSHELRTPLTSILGFSSYLLSGKLGKVGERQVAALESVHRQARRLSAIISDFLDVSRIESGRIEMRQEPLRVDQVAEKVFDDLRPQAQEKSIRLSQRLANGVDPVAMADEQRLTQVLTNLIGNALKFTDDNGHVELHISHQDNRILCEVRDDGCGIPADELPRVFDRFYQVQKVVTRKTGGTGLGLAIVKHIVEAHGGQIWMESEFGKGTSVFFTLPVAPDSTPMTNSA